MALRAKGKEARASRDNAGSATRSAIGRPSALSTRAERRSRPSMRGARTDPPSRSRQATSGTSRWSFS
eukprot:5573308-Alexandrium_andersonii.AAC.1